LADRWGEPDPRKIADLPADILLHWQAFLNMKNPATGITEQEILPPTGTASKTTEDQLFLDNLRILGNG